MLNLRSNRVAWLAGMAATALTATGAAAQHVPRSDAWAENKIIVTANRREQMAQELPLARAAVGDVPLGALSPKLPPSSANDEPASGQAGFAHHFQFGQPTGEAQ